VQILARLGIAAAALAAIVGSQAAAANAGRILPGQVDRLRDRLSARRQATTLSDGLVARHLGKYIPGHPSIVPKNTPGAGSFLAVNQIFNVAPKDGTVIGIGRADHPARRRGSDAGRALQDRRAQLIGRVDS